MHAHNPDLQTVLVGVRRRSAAMGPATLGRSRGVLSWSVQAHGPMSRISGGWTERVRLTDGAGAG